MNQAITSQALSFCPVIPAAGEPEGQIRDAEGNVWIQIKADHASYQTECSRSSVY